MAACFLQWRAALLTLKKKLKIAFRVPVPKQSKLGSTPIFRIGGFNAARLPLRRVRWLNQRVFAFSTTAATERF